MVSMYSGHRIRVFLSSTFEDLRNERQAIIATLNGFPQIEMVNMEDFGARPRRPLKECTQEVIGSHVYIAVLGRLYGSEDESGVSYTQHEYDASRRKGLPCYIYILTNKVGDGGESLSKKKRLAQFRSELQKAHVYAERSSMQLPGQIVHDLGRDLGFGKEGTDARNLLWLMAMSASPATPEEWTALLEGVGILPEGEDSHLRELNQMRIANALSLLGDLCILNQKSSDGYGVGQRVRSELRRHIEKHGGSLRAQFVRYVLEDLKQWNERQWILYAEKMPKETPQDRKDRTRYLSAFNTLVRDPKDDLVVDYTILLIGDGVHGGFLTFWGRWEDALRTAKKAQPVVQRSRNLYTTARFLWALAVIYFNLHKYQNAQKLAQQAEPAIKTLGNAEDTKMIHRLIIKTTRAIKAGAER